MSQDQKSEFALFIDESGSPKPNPKDTANYFALGGVLVKLRLRDRSRGFGAITQIFEMVLYCLAHISYGKLHFRYSLTPL
jgi:hypothetical protein